MSYVRDPQAGPFALATPMGVQLLDDLIVRIVHDDNPRLPSAAELSEVGIDDKAVLGNFFGAQVIYLELALDDNPESEERIWDRLEREFWPIPN